MDPGLRISLWEHRILIEVQTALQKLADVILINTRMVCDPPK